MTLSVRKVWLIVGLIVVAVTGLVVLQVLLLSNAMDSKESAFRRNALAAMGSVVQALEEQEALATARELARRPGHDEDSVHFSVMAYSTDSDLPAIDGNPVWCDTSAPRVKIVDQTLEYDLPSSQRVILFAMDSSGQRDSVIIDSVYDSGKHILPLDSTVCRSGTWVMRLQTDSTMENISISPGPKDAGLPPGINDSGRVSLVRRVVSNLFIGEMRPIPERLESDQVDSLLSHYMTDAGIDLDFAYAVITQAEDSVALAEPPELAPHVANSDLRVQLFPNDIFSDRADLAVFFPGRTSYLWFQIGPMLGATALFVAIIIFCFVYSIRTITAQRRNARLMVDFVNNMTHEFKTPISTVALACEAILRPDVIEDRKKVSEFSRMIQSENKRMRKQAEKILQMATLEDKDYELALSEVDVHEVIQNAVDTIDLQVKSRQGTITCRLDAVNPVITADRVHLEAMIQNLLDNANKYSPESPDISVRTRNGAQGLLIEIEDRGVGLKEEDRKRVFEKYFRVSSGDRHDVKGFGLGLSYVELMMDAHGGRVTLKSTYGRGTTVRLIFPAGPVKDAEAVG